MPKATLAREAPQENFRYISLQDVSFRDRDMVRQVPGSRYLDGQWRCPLSWVVLRQLIGIFGPTLEWDEALADWSWDYWRSYVRPVTDAREHALDLTYSPSFQTPLYPYQCSGAAFLLAAKQAALCDEMGTGKTVQTITALETAGAYPALVVVPKSGKASWIREYRKWAPHRDVVSVGGSADRRRRTLAEQHDVYVVHWDALRLHSRIAGYGSIRLSEDDRRPKELNHIPWAAVVADEAHRAINPKAKQTRALWAVSAEAEYRLALTGTPIANTPADLWSILHYLNPADWPSRTRYLDRYCLSSWNQWGGLEVVGLRADTRDEFMDLTELRIIRRTKDCVLPWLPPKVRQRRDVEMTPRQARVYKDIKEDCLTRLDGGTLLAINPLQELTRLTQAASSCIDIDENGEVHCIGPSSKVDELIDLLDEMGDAPLVVFAQSSQLIALAADRLAREGISFQCIVGGQSDLVREMAEQSFMSGESRVLLLTLGAGSEVLTLTRASTICFMQRSWSMIQNLQAEDRIHRPGQEGDEEGNVLIIDFVASDTVEEAQQEALENKTTMMEEVVAHRDRLREVIAA